MNKFVTTVVKQSNDGGYQQKLKLFAKIVIQYLVRGLKISFQPKPTTTKVLVLYIIK